MAAGVVNTMGPGDYFGEMSLIDGKPRSASVVAKGDLRTLAIPAWNFGRLLDENPDIMKALLVAMSDRIRKLRDRGTNDLIQGLTRTEPPD